MTSVRLILDLTLTPQTAVSFLLFRATMPVSQTNLVPISDTSLHDPVAEAVLYLSYSNDSVTTSQDNRSTGRLNFAFTLTPQTAALLLLIPLHNAGIPNEPNPKSEHLPKFLRRNHRPLTSNVFYDLLCRRMSHYPTLGGMWGKPTK